MERHAHCSTQHPPVATDTRGRQMGSKTKFVGNVCLILRRHLVQRITARASDASCRPLHCHCDAESTDRAPSMASQIDFDRNAEQLPIELASVVGTAARLHMLSASSQVTSRSWVGRPTCRQQRRPRANQMVIFRPVVVARAHPVRAESAWPRPCKLEL
jgi:hypothetical protein